jgi:hypothetical protein
MSQTTTALGTVPQEIVNLDGTALVTSTGVFTTLSEFDTHGSERIAFQVSAEKGTYTVLDVVFQVRDAGDGTYYDAPTSLSRVFFDPEAEAPAVAAFTLFLGRNIDKIRIQYLTAGAPDAASNLVISGMLTAPTYPIIGGTL